MTYFTDDFLPTGAEQRILGVVNRGRLPIDSLKRAWRLF